jgi:hypothetical protein
MMRTKDFAFVALKVLAIYIFFRAITQLFAFLNLWVYYSNLPYNSTEGLSSTIVLLNFLAAVFLFFMCHLLWQFTQKIANHIVPKDDSIAEQDKETLKLKNLQTAAFTVVGVIILSYAIPNIFHVAGEIIRDKDSFFPVASAGGVVNPTFIKMILNIIGHLIYLLIGIFLLFRSKGSLKFVEKLRKEGIGKHISKFFKKLRRE